MGVNHRKKRENLNRIEERGRVEINDWAEIKKRGRKRSLAAANNDKLPWRVYLSRSRSNNWTPNDRSRDRRVPFRDVLRISNNSILLFFHRSCFPDIFLNLGAKRNIAATTVPFPNLQALNRPKIGRIKLRNYLHFVPRSRNQVPQLNDHDIPSKRLFPLANEAISTPSIFHRNFVRHFRLKIRNRRRRIFLRTLAGY